MMRLILDYIYNCRKIKGMPKCEFDPVFQDQLQRFVSDNALTVNGAATALESSKKKIRKALATRDKRITLDDAVFTVDGGTQLRPTLHGVLAD